MFTDLEPSIWRELFNRKTDFYVPLETWWAWPCQQKLNSVIAAERCQQLQKRNKRCKTCKFKKRGASFVRPIWTEEEETEDIEQKNNQSHRETRMATKRIAVCFYRKIFVFNQEIENRIKKQCKDLRMCPRYLSPPYSCDKMEEIEVEGQSIITCRIKNEKGSINGQAQKHSPQKIKRTDLAGSCKAREPQKIQKETP